MKTLCQILLVFSLIFLAGCGSFVSNSDVPSGIYLGAEGRPKISDLADVMIIQEKIDSSGHGIAVSGTSCQNKLWQDSPSSTNAIALMKQEAAKEGMKYIYSVRVESSSTSLATNCWASITARGMAYTDKQPARQSLDNIDQKQTGQRDKRLDTAVALLKPFADCVKLRATSPELYTSSESADVVARAALGLCLNEEGAYRSAVYQLAMVSSVNPNAMISDVHQKFLDMALTIIVAARQHLRDAPPNNAPAKSKEQPA